MSSTNNAKIGIGESGSPERTAANGSDKSRGQEGVTGGGKSSPWVGVSEERKKRRKGDGKKEGKEDWKKGRKGPYARPGWSVEF